MHSVFPLLLTAAVFASADSLTLALPSEPGPLDPPSSSAANRGLHKAELTLDQAIARALGMSPSLAAGSSAVSAAEARFTQAGLLPNPEIELEAARVLLAATWGSSRACFDQAVGELPEPTAPPSLGQLRPHLLEAPEVTRLENQIERQQRLVELERLIGRPLDPHADAPTLSHYTTRGGRR